MDATTTKIPISENADYSPNSSISDKNDKLLSEKEPQSLELQLGAERETNTNNSTFVKTENVLHEQVQDHLQESEQNPNITITNGNNTEHVECKVPLSENSHINLTKSELATKKQYKKRRRIIINESNSDLESDNECTTPPVTLKEHTEPISECYESEDSESSTSEEIFINEKPKPKCKKQSTIIKKQLQIRKLLENAIIIPVPPVKCNILRPVISSSDEKEEEENKPSSEAPILLRCHKRKLFESSSSHASESDSNILITEPIQDTAHEKYRIDEDPISVIVLPTNIDADNESLSYNNCDDDKESPVNGNTTQNVTQFSAASGESDIEKEHMPNAVYFGDIQVPLNVLHHYEDDNEIYNQASESNVSSDEIYSSESEKSLKKEVNNKIRVNKSIKANRAMPNKRSEVEKLKACIKAANIKIKYNELFEDCTNDSERADAIREVLEDHGLRGEPTIAKCRKLKKNVKVKQEIAELDRSAIIEKSGRTLRSAGIIHKSDNFSDLYGKELLRKTMSTIRNLVDTDSD